MKIVSQSTREWLYSRLVHPFTKEINMCARNSPRSPCSSLVTEYNAGSSRVRLPLEDWVRRNSCVFHVSLTRVSKFIWAKHEVGEASKVKSKIKGDSWKIENWKISSFSFEIEAFNYLPLWFKHWKILFNVYLITSLVKMFDDVNFL